MLTPACAILFAVAGLFAVAVIVHTLTRYTPDVMALRASRHRTERERHVVWRILSTGAGQPVRCGAAVSVSDLWSASSWQALPVRRAA